MFVKSVENPQARIFSVNSALLSLMPEKNLGWGNLKTAVATQATPTFIKTHNQGIKAKSPKLEILSSMPQTF